MTYLIRCRGGHLTATDRDRFAQLDGTAIPAPLLKPGDSVPGLGRVVSVARVEEVAA